MTMLTALTGEWSGRSGVTPTPRRCFASSLVTRRLSTEGSGDSRNCHRNSVEHLSNRERTAVSANNLITTSVFSAFLKCPTKAHLLVIGEPNSETFFAALKARISSMYKATALGAGQEFAEALDFGQLDSSDHPDNISR